MHKVFISYHHENDQCYKDELVRIGERHSTFIDRSVDSGEIADNLSDEQIRRTIRDKHLRDSTVTIVLVGIETKNRKHIDWEIYSSMYNGSVNKSSGILVITLPSIPSSIIVAHGDWEKKLLYPNIRSWTPIGSREECERNHPNMPDRIIDNIIRQNVKISVVPWNKINEESLNFLIEATFKSRLQCKYDLCRPMKRSNS